MSDEQETAMSEKTRWVVEMLMSESGDSDGQVFDDVEKLGSFVRVNAADADQFRIVQTTDDAIARLMWGQIDDDVAEARGD